MGDTLILTDNKPLARGQIQIFELI